MQILAEGIAAGAGASELAKFMGVGLTTLQHWRHEFKADGNGVDRRKGAADLVVLDELGLALAYGLLDEAEVVATLGQRPSRMDVILTGPEMPASLMALADQVTELRRDRC